MRVAWWSVTFATIASLAFDAVAVTLGLCASWAAFSALAAYWPCPRCNRRVGVIDAGLIALLIPFGGWCVACGARLFGRRARMNAS